MEISAKSPPFASLPVVFFDGEREMDIGSVLVHPSLSFQRFKALISQKIGISPHRISTSLVRRKWSLPLKESSDLLGIAGEMDCFILAGLKRSRRERALRRGEKGGPETKTNTILRRLPATESALGFKGTAGFGGWEYGRSAVCDECEGGSEDFHWCVHDAVTVGFRSAVGPIQRP